MRPALLTVAVWLLVAGCGDRNDMPPDVEAGIAELEGALGRGDTDAACAAVADLEPRLRHWEESEGASFSLFGVAERRARAIELERRQLREWHAACALGEVTAARLSGMRNAWSSTAANLRTLGTTPGHRRTATWLLVTGVAFLLLLLVFFVVVFQIRSRRESFGVED